MLPRGKVPVRTPAKLCGTGRVWEAAPWGAPPGPPQRAAFPSPAPAQPAAIPVPPRARTEPGWTPRVSTSKRLLRPDVSAAEGLSRGAGSAPAPVHMHPGPETSLSAGAFAPSFRPRQSRGLSQGSLLLHLFHCRQFCTVSPGLWVPSEHLFGITRERG